MYVYVQCISLLKIESEIFRTAVNANEEILIVRYIFAIVDERIYHVIRRAVKFRAIFAIK